MNFWSKLNQDPQKKLEEQIREFSLKYQQNINEIQIFKMFISDQDDEFAIWKNAESQVKSVCGANVENGQLTFQCFTCAPDPHHMYCYKCFNPDIHLNHKCIIKHNIGGACDCGDEQTIIPSGFCSKHQGVSKFDYNQELNKISDSLKKKIENFIKALCTIYLNLMKRIKQDHNMFNVILLKFYHISEKWLITPFKEVIDSEYDIEEYYRIFQQALFLNTILFKMCYWFTESRLCFIILLSQIFQQKLTQESKQTIFEDVFEVQVLLESQGPQPALKIESLLFRFYADYSFKQFIQVCYLKQYASMWLQTKKKVTKYDKLMEDYLIKLQTIKSLQFAQAQHEALLKMAQVVKNYIQKYKESTEITIGLNLSEIHEQHTQYVAERLQEVFLSHQYIQNIYNQIRDLSILIHSQTPISSLSQLQYSVIFKLRYEYNFFYKVGFKQLQEALGDYYQQFIHGQITKEIIQNFKYDQFTITSYLNCYNQIKPQHLDILEEHLTIWQQDLQDAAIQVILVGIQRLFSSQFSTLQFQENISKLLLTQSYQILKKKYKGISVDSQLNEAYKKYIENKNLTPAEIFDRLSKIFLVLMKSITVVERVFTFILSYLYCLKNFESGTEFESYLLDILQEDKKELKNNFYEVLSKCLQMYVSVQFCQNQFIEQIYLGLNDQQDQVILESFDSSFLRIYLFLYENEGFQDLNKIMDNRRIIKSGSDRILCCLLLRILSSDLDLYNVCCSTLKELPRDLKLSLAKAIQNFYNLSTFLSFTDIESKLRRMGIQACSNLPDHVLQICEVDQALKQLKLRSEYRVIYDPAIFNINTAINSQIVEKLVEQNKSENEIHLGNGICWDVELFKNNNYRIILYNILKRYCQKEYINKNLDLLKTEGFALIQAYQLLYIQLVAANYFMEQEFKTYAPFIIIQLEQILGVTQRKDDIQRIQVLISEINKLITVVKPVVIQKQPQVKDTKINLQNKKNQFKEKYNKLQKSEFIQNMLESNDIKDNNDEKDVNVCSSCKLPLSQQSSVALMLLIKKPQTSNFSIISKESLECFKNNQFNLIDVGVACCKHYFHYTCLIERFESDQQYRRQNAPDWVKIGCPVCKLPCTITLPIQRQLTNLDVESFNQDLQLFVTKNAIENLFEDQITAQKTLAETYYNIFFDLLISLFHNPSEYIRDQKNIVFHQLLLILNATNMEAAKAKIIEQFQFQTENNFILNILSLIQKYVVIEKDLQKFKVEVLSSCNQYNIRNEIYIQLALSLEIQDELLQQAIQFEKQIVKQENFNQYALINQLQLEDQLKSIIGLTFKEFYNKYFTKKCFACGFYNKDQRHGGFSMCLFCSKTFCIYSCNKDIKTGNLNLHANKEHNGISIYVNLENGYVTLLCSPISIQYYKCLFYNQLGQRIDIENSNSDWNSFNLDIQKLREISQIIMNSSYQAIIRNLEVRQNQLDMDGYL
ncbi:unnamed protein product [Paramecium primaurelia]|uniref:RING-type E3 ubiquitin transferase n=1 Tax=Paramecium primaurelia TaxID=5886 RepID=A0A8S1NFT8_PARPR|nr:unnamed protein product [Paramecium primaurelia]